jgi:exosortase/archaeosortase family protein
LASEGFAVSIVAECTAVGPLVLFMGAVAAYPSPLRSKGIGLVLGAVVLTAVNLFRIMSLFWIGSNYPEYPDIAHLLVWQTVIILIAILLWLFWVDRLAGVRNA